jgi:hypothetical protein
MSTAGLDIRELLDYLATHDGRTVDLVAVYAWHEQAVLGAWSKQDAFDAVLDFYRQDPQPCWQGTDTPRPVLPADINAHIERRGRV